ncbi:MAG: ATP citrate lyase citrate-binding domain-containing protein [Patescibacteria group bacterium]
MRLIETDGKRLLAEMGVVVPAQGGDGPFFVKAQVLRGGRGKAGLVRRAETSQDAERVKKEIEAALGHAPERGFLVEREVPHVREWLLSIDLDRAAGEWRVNIGEGGVSVTSARSEPLTTFENAKFGSLVRALAEGMRAHRLQSVEINPLAELEDGSFVALDAKIVTEDDVAVSSVDLDGDIALVLSGGGASLVALDALLAVGGRPANFVELSGNPDIAIVREAAGRVFLKPGLKAVWVAGSYANFTDIAAMLSAIRDAYDAAGLSVPFVVRRDGPNADQAQSETLAWAEAKGITCLFHRAETDLEASARELLSLI